jgi:hypothetical protein
LLIWLLGVKVRQQHPTNIDNAYFILHDTKTHFPTIGAVVTLAFMAKKTVIPQYSRSEHLRNITRKLLDTIESRIESINVADEDEIKQIKASNDLLFGNKLSIAENLVILADLLVKMGDKTTDSSADILEKNSSHNLSEYDITLVEAFVKKLKDTQ